MIDDYLQWFRESLGEVFAREFSDLPLEVPLALVQREKDILAQSISKCRDPEGRRQLEARLRETEEIAELVGSVCDTRSTLTPGQNKILEKVERSTCELAIPLPSQYPRQSNCPPRQTPLHPELFSSAGDAPPGEIKPWRGKEPPQFIVQKRSECLNMVVGSLVLLNETHVLAVQEIRPILKERLPDREFVDDDIMEATRNVWPTDTLLDVSERQIELSPYLVAIALVPELLRLYCQVVDGRPDLVRGEIENVLSEDAFKALLQFRNVVFHAVRNPADFSEALQNALDQTEAPALWEIYRGIFNFLLSELVDVNDQL